MSTTPREIGTLIVVVFKARNLPNKRHIGKQDPYCVVHLNGERRRTKAIKRGGQHPEWDEEIRFTLYEDNSASQTSSSESGAPPPPPPKKQSKDAPEIQGGKYMFLACYAEDLKEPELIGETRVDLTEVLTQGETDEWFTLMCRDRYSGEVYLELTFWSNAPAPVKKSVLKPRSRKQYGGPGTFTAHSEPRGLSESPGGSPGPPTHHSQGASWSSKSSNTWKAATAELTPETLPSSLRSSSSIAQVGLYRPSYETNNTAMSQGSLSHRPASTIDSLTDELGQMNLRRRLSLPQMTHSELVQQSLLTPGHSSRGPSAYGHGPSSSYSDEDVYERTPSSFSSASQIQAQLTGPSLYHPPYEPISRSSSVYSTQTPGQTRGPRLSLPASSSGFMPIPMQAPSSFNAPPQQHPAYQQSIPATPAPQLYRASGPPVPTPTPSAYGPRPVPTPGPANMFRPPAATPAPVSYASSAHSHAPSSSVSSISHQYNAPLPSTPYHPIPQSQSQSAYNYQPYTSGTPNYMMHQYPQQAVAASNATPSLVMQHTVQQVQHQQQQQQYVPPQNQVWQPPLPPASVPPPPSFALHQHPTGTQAPAQPYSTAIDHRGIGMSGSTNHLSVNIPPPPPLNSSPPQGQTSRPLPVIPPGGPSPMQRRPTTSLTSPGVIPGPPGIQPSVSYPAYTNIPPPPPLSNPSNMSPSRRSPQVPQPPAIPNTRRLSLPPPPQQQQQQQQVIPGPPPPPPSRAPSSQALYHNAMSRQASGGGHPLPSPPGVQGQQQSQSAYYAMQPPARPQSFIPPPPNHHGQGGFASQPLQPSYYPGAPPMPSRMPSSQQYPVANGWH